MHGHPVAAFYLKLPLCPSIVCTNSEGTGETARICMVAGAFAVCLCDDENCFLLGRIFH